MITSLHTTRSMITTVAKRWDSQYASYPANHVLRGRKTVGEISTALNELSESATVEDVASIIGNTSWTHLKCSRCNEEPGAVVVLSNDASEFKLCQKCVEEIRWMFSTEKAFPDTEVE